MPIFTAAKASAWISKFPNPENYPYFSVASREWRPSSYYDTNTRGCIIPGDVIHRDKIDEISDEILQILQDCTTIEAAFCSYLTDLDTFSNWFRKCENVYGLIEKVRFELHPDDMKRCLKIMSIPGMMDEYFKSYSSFMTIVANTPIHQRVTQHTRTEFKIDLFTFNNIYI